MNRTEQLWVTADTLRARLSAEKEHWEYRATQSEQTIEALRQDKANVHSLLKQLELAREDEVKRLAQVTPASLPSLLQAWAC